MSSYPLFSRHLALLLPLIALPASSPSLAAESLPADVTAFVDRSEACMHWAGEEAFDKARARQIQAALSKNKCDHLEKDSKLLQQRHAQNPKARQAIKEAVSWL